MRRIFSFNASAVTLRTRLFFNASIALYFVVFIAVSSSVASAAIIVNEICYRARAPYAASGDWIELFNGSPGAIVDLSGWILEDDAGHAYTNPPNTFIMPYGYLVIYSDPAFATVWPSVTNCVGPSNIGFGSNSDDVILRRPSGKVEDQLTYYVVSNGWPDADGKSIELRYPYNDNRDPSVWFASTVPSPGARNPNANGIHIVAHNRQPDGPTSSDQAIITIQTRDAFSTGLTAYIHVSWGGAYVDYAMTPLPSDQFTITLPPTNNGMLVRYYFSFSNVIGQTAMRWWNDSKNEPYLYLVDDNPLHSGLVINEIMYNSLPLWHDGKKYRGYEYVEIYNTLTTAVNVGYWRFQDSDDKFRLPPDVLIPADGYLLLADKTQAVLDVYGAMPSNAVMLALSDMGLANSGEELRWQNINGEMVSRVAYSDSPPWPTAPDGNGPSLELIDWHYDTQLASSWAASIEPTLYGTPGRPNSVIPEPTLLSITVLAAIARIRRERVLMAVTRRHP
jgi:hypothetical protein